MRCEFASEPRPRHASSPLVHLRLGVHRSSCSFPPKGRAERQGVSPRPRRHVGETRGSRAPKAHGKQSSLGRSAYACVPHAMDFAACCMSQEASQRRRCPVRASCCPDMHLGRPPVLPASVPYPPSRISDPESSVKVRHRGGHRIPLSSSQRRLQRAP